MKLISLDSKEGSLVSVAVAGPGAAARTREVLWRPPLDHPNLRAPADMHGRRYKGQGTVFAKGLALQGGVAYFGVSPARRPGLRLSVDPCLLVAFDLAARRELWLRPIPTRGLLNQVLSQAYLGVALQIREGKRAQNAAATAAATAARQQYASSQFVAMYAEGGRGDVASVMAGKAPAAAEAPTGATAACLDPQTGRTKLMPLLWKPGNQRADSRLPDTDDAGRVERKLCRLDTSAVRDRLVAMGDGVWDKNSPVSKTNAILSGRKDNMRKFKPGVDSIHLIFSDRKGTGIYHFPWLDDWLPYLRPSFLDPLGINVDSIVRMQFAKMNARQTLATTALCIYSAGLYTVGWFTRCVVARIQVGSDIKTHVDRGPWVLRTHRVHVPVLTHDKIEFLVRTKEKGIVKVEFDEGEVFELNNGFPHMVHNTGSSDRIHLIVDWAEGPRKSVQKLARGQVCRYGREIQC